MNIPISVAVIQEIIRYQNEHFGLMPCVWEIDNERYCQLLEEGKEYPRGYHLSSNVLIMGVPVVSKIESTATPE